MQDFLWGHPGRFNDFRYRFRSFFPGEKIQKISVDPGFTCPNRDGSKATGGCTYCNNAAFTPYFSHVKETVTLQLQRGIGFFARKYPGMQYLAYFQSFSNTYAPVEQLQNLYQEALSFPGVRGLVIATRPDCIDEEKTGYLASLAKEHYIMLEIGIESHLDSTLRNTNRGHTFGDSVRALHMASRWNLNTTAHLIIGLPGETRDDWLDQARTISELPVGNLKLHQFQIHKDTAVADRYSREPGEFQLFTAEGYAETVVDYLELLNPDITVERFTSQAPSGFLIAPAWGLKNHEFTARVNKLLKERGTWQGIAYRGSSKSM
jgi:radical SAM protein (TIGR01212 family)